MLTTFRSLGSKTWMRSRIGWEGQRDREATRDSKYATREDTVTASSIRGKEKWNKESSRQDKDINALILQKCANECRLTVYGRIERGDIQTKRIEGKGWTKVKVMRRL